MVIKSVKFINNNSRIILKHLGRFVLLCVCSGLISLSQILAQQSDIVLDQARYYFFGEFNQELNTLRFYSCVNNIEVDKSDSFLNTNKDNQDNCVDAFISEDGDVFEVSSDSIRIMSFKQSTQFNDDQLSDYHQIFDEYSKLSKQNKNIGSISLVALPLTTSLMYAQIIKKFCNFIKNIFIKHICLNSIFGIYFGTLFGSAKFFRWRAQRINDDFQHKLNALKQQEFSDVDLEESMTASTVLLHAVYSEGQFIEITNHFQIGDIAMEINKSLRYLMEYYRSQTPEQIIFNISSYCVPDVLQLDLMECFDLEQVDQE